MMRRFTSVFTAKRDKNSSSSSSSSNSDHTRPPSWKSWIRSSQKRLQPLHHDIDEDDSQSEEAEEDDHHNIRIHIQNTLAVHPHPNSPFVRHPDQPIYPRSSNSPHTLSPHSSTPRSMFNAHLLARLNSDSMSPNELSAVLPFAAKPTPSLITHPILPPSDIPRPKNSSHISSASLGIQRWITRPCFEDRVAVYLPTDSGIQCRPVISSMAIAALEYPEYLDVMVDPDFDQSPSNVSHHAPPVDTVPATQSHGTFPDTNTISVTPLHWRNSYTAVPSPLRIQHSPPPTTIASTKLHMPVAVTPAPKSTVKRVVRFAEDDEDDGIPLHMVRMKKKREEKASFLRMEQLKRVKEEEDERKLQEQEALEREHRRLAKEKERKEIEKALYAETVASARMRREGHRAGTILPSNTANSSNPLPTSPSFTSLRNSERNKPLTDPRKPSSKPPPFDSTTTLSNPRRDNSDSSPGSSRPPSIGHSPVSPTYPSRSPSTYSAHTSSSEDVRQQRGSKRNSVTATVAAGTSGSSSHHRPPVSSFPSWSGSSHSLHPIPQVPPLPHLVHDMPLLPPTAPFMKGSSYNRMSKSPGPSSSSRSRRGSFSSSNERVNQLLPPQTMRTSSTSPHHYSSSTAPTSRSSKPDNRPTHERRSSSDSTTLSIHPTQHQQRPTPTSSWSYPSRGRPALPSSPQYLQTLSPWPSQNGLVPMAIPMPMGYGPAYPVLLYPTGPMPTMQGVPLGSGGGGGGMGGNSSGWREPLIS